MGIDTKKSRTRKIVLWLSALVGVMFLFCYAMVPLYNSLCKQLGINGKVELKKAAESSDLDESRVIRVGFTTTVPSGVPVTFYTKTRYVDLHPGQNARVLFYIKNNTNQSLVIQAIPSITPGLAARHLKKTQCFCFTQQTLKPNESRDMPVVFHMDNETPADINEVTLSYTLFKAIQKS